MDKIDIIVPCFNEEKVLSIFYNSINQVCKKMPGLMIDLIFIDDGSTDSTLERLKKIARNDSKVHYISFSRNFGKEAAIFAGLKASNGNYVVIMDVDLQDPPELLPNMYKEIISNNIDCVSTRRVSRKGEPPIRSIFAHVFYRLINKITQVEIVDGARDYRIMTRQMVNAILSMPEYNRFSKGIFSWVGFKTQWMEYENVERADGETKWSFWNLLKYSIEGVIGFTTAPLAFASIVGVIIFLLSIILIIYIVIKTLIWGDPVAGWPAMACIILFVGGIQLFCLGISSQYLARTYLEVKRRPIFITRESNLSEIYNIHEKDLTENAQKNTGFTAI